MKSKNILVVGGGRGIGRAAAQLLESGGYRITVVDNDLEDLQGLNVEGGCFELDITNRSAVQQFIEVQRTSGTTYYSIIISAGVHSTHPAMYLTDEIIDYVMDINFAAHVKFVRDIIPQVEDGGRIICVSSIGATVGLPMSSIYSASKGALELFYEALSTELKPQNISSVIVQPGNVNTGFNETGNTFIGSDNKTLNANYSRFVESIDSRFGISPKIVGQAIVQAVTSRKPKLCYVVGANAKKAYWARRLLGRLGAVVLLRKYLKFKAEPNSVSGIL